MAFDTVMSVDWSASSIPKRGSDSCWVASMRLRGARRWMVENPATRLAAMETIRDVIDDEMRAGRRCLIVIDVSLGFPAGTADVLGLRSRPRWRAMWRALESRSTDTPENVNNRIAVADALNVESGVRLFWGRPAATSFDQFQNVPIRNLAVLGLADNALAPLRRSEALAGGGVQSNWMLVGRGAVGGQVLTCLPHLERLVSDLEGAIAVWPFCGLSDPGTPVVLAETWHSLFPFDEQGSSCRDEAQVRGTAEAFRARNADLGSYFAPPSLVALSRAEQGRILDEEGWTLGVL